MIHEYQDIHMRGNGPAYRVVQDVRDEVETSEFSRHSRALDSQALADDVRDLYYLMTRQSARSE